MEHSSYIEKSKKRFEGNYIINAVTGCWEWSKARNKAGYAMFRLLPNIQHGHRAAYVMFNGLIPDGFYVRHKCDNPCCVNPAHLELGTPKDNNQDTVARGRRKPAGSIAPHKRIKNLSDDDVRAIRVFVGPLKDVADRYNTSIANVSMIRSGKRKQNVIQ